MGSSVLFLFVCLWTGVVFDFWPLVLWWRTRFNRVSSSYSQEAAEFDDSSSLTSFLAFTFSRRLFSFTLSPKDVFHKTRQVPRQSVEDKLWPSLEPATRGRSRGCVMCLNNTKCCFPLHIFRHRPCCTRTKPLHEVIIVFISEENDLSTSCFHTLGWDE